MEGFSGPESTRHFNVITKVWNEQYPRKRVLTTTEIAQLATQSAAGKSDVGAGASSNAGNLQPGTNSSESWPFPVGRAAIYKDYD